MRRLILLTVGPSTRNLRARSPAVIGPSWRRASSRKSWPGCGPSRLKASLPLAVRCDLQRSECRFNGETIGGLFRVSNVWRRDQEGWQLVTIQYTSVAPEAVPTSTG